jgi:hypothetical protein
MKLQLAPTRTVTIGAVTAIAEGVTPVSSDTPFSVIWTLIKRLAR